MTNLPTQATGDSPAGSIRWLHTGESFQLERYFFKDETIGAKCGQDCYDLDLAVYDPKIKKPIAVDDDGSTEPAILAPYEGEFVLEIDMKNCAAAGGCRTWVAWEE
ncbi:MAG: hypothetical protein AAF716_11900 [Cyanobacteria bacterium P01_D01_bin.1]